MDKDLLVNKLMIKSLSEMFSLHEKVNIIAGPCSVENVDQLEEIAKTLKKFNVKFFRGGAFKPRTSPYDFQGLGLLGLEMLKEIKEKYGFFIVSEVMDPRYVEESMKYIDIIQIGSRNMQNFSLLKEVGKTNSPVLLKRGMMATLNEYLLAAEYILKEGNRNIILCERGIRTFEDSTRNTLDISSIAIIKRYTSLPIIVDLSHSLGRKDIIIPIAKAVLALDVDGIMVEVHNNPESALSDSKQQLNFEEFENLVENIDRIY